MVFFAQSASGGNDINASGNTKDTNQFSSSSGTFVDVTGFSVTLTTTATSTVIAQASGSVSNNTAGNPIFLKLLIDGTEVETKYIDELPSAGGYRLGFSLIGRKINVAAGSVVCKLQVRTNGTSTATICGKDITTDAGNNIVAFAIKQ